MAIHQRLSGLLNHTGIESERSLKSPFNHFSLSLCCLWAVCYVDTELSKRPFGLWIVGFRFTDWEAPVHKLISLMGVELDFKHSSRNSMSSHIVGSLTNIYDHQIHGKSLLHQEQYVVLASILSVFSHFQEPRTSVWVHTRLLEVHLKDYSNALGQSEKFFDFRVTSWLWN